MTGRPEKDIIMRALATGTHPTHVLVHDGKRTLIVTRAEAAAGMVRYARQELGRGTPAAGEVERQALNLLRKKGRSR